jgi:hypothetical protein
LPFVSADSSVGDGDRAEWDDRDEVDEVDKFDTESRFSHFPAKRREAGPRFGQS